MEEDARDGLKYYLVVSADHESDLLAIRKWDNLKVASESRMVWIKDFTYAQINSIEVKSMAFKTIYYERNGRLHYPGHALPERITPSLLWTPIQRAITLSLPTLNHNFFGIDQKIDVALISGTAERDPSVIVASVSDLKHYLTNAIAIRTQVIRWMLLADDKVLLSGTPLLPIPGKTYWSMKDHVIPTGYEFELPILSDVIQTKINPGRDHLILWNFDHSFSLLPKEHLMPLSKSSLHNTLAANHKFTGE